MAIIFFPDLEALRPMTRNHGAFLTNSLHLLPIEWLSQHGASWEIRAGFEELFAADRLISGTLLLAFCGWR